MLALLFLSLAEEEPAPEEPLQENDTASDVVLPKTTPVVRKVGAHPRIKKLVKATDQTGKVEKKRVVQPKLELLERKPQEERSMAEAV